LVRRTEWITKFADRVCFN